MSPTPNSDVEFTDFQALFAASPNAYVLLDSELTIVEVNEAYMETTGRERDELLGLNLFDAFPGNPDDPVDPNVRRLKASLERVLSTGERDSLALIPYRIPEKTPEGEVSHEERYWSATHTPIFNEDGDVEYILQHTADVTDLYQEERLSDQEGPETGPARVENAREKETSKGGATTQQLEKRVFSRAEEVQQAYWRSEAERDRLQRLFEQAPGFMTFLRGPDHVFEMANDAYYQVVGNRDILGKPVREALPEVESQGFPELLDQVYESGEPFVGREVEVQLEREPGEDLETVYLDFVYQPVTGPDGSVTGIFVQGHDVTEKKRTKERLRRRQGELKTLNDTLEEQVEERTRQVRRLTSRVTMAEQRERDRIARFLHDDLQQKLFGIRLKLSSLQEGTQTRANAPNSETAQTESEDDENRRGAEQDQTSTQVEELKKQMEEAIQMTRRVSVGMSPPVLDSEGLTAALEWLQSQMKETRELTVQLKAEEEFRMEEQMRVLLFQIVRELLSNVAEHAGVNEATVQLKKEMGRLLIEVSDNGSGLDPDLLQHGRPEEGFGLTAAQERLRLFNGDLIVDSTPGEGTRVSVHVPMDSNLNRPSSSGEQTSD